MRGLEIPWRTCYNKNVEDILLIAADWKFRALVRAQLLEEGYSVKAVLSPEMAFLHLVRTGERPRLVIFDMQNMAIDAPRLMDLWRLTQQAPMILCCGALDRTELKQADLPPVQMMWRPFRVGDLIQEVQKVIRCRQDDPIGDSYSSALG